MSSLLPSSPASRRWSARYTLAGSFPATTAVQGFVPLVQLTFPTAVAITHLSLMTVWPDARFCLAGVVVIPADATGAMSKDPVFFGSPDQSGRFPLMYTPSEDLLLHGLFSRLDLTVSRRGRFVLPARAFLF
jgi:hypothetical protein